MRRRNRRRGERMGEIYIIVSLSKMRQRISIETLLFLIFFFFLLFVFCFHASSIEPRPEVIIIHSFHSFFLLFFYIYTYFFKCSMYVSPVMGSVFSFFSFFLFFPLSFFPTHKEEEGAMWRKSTSVVRYLQKMREKCAVAR